MRRDLIHFAGKPLAGRYEPASNDHEMKYVFVCGLHRSGTTILAQKIGELKNCTAFENTGAIMDEGQHLQDVYLPDYIYGGVGKFGFASEAHLTEDSPLLTPENVSRLRQSWEGYWDRNKTIRIEKTPGNLLMTRFLQAAFPNTYFVVIKRHPVAVSLASQKWSRTSLHHLFEHWLQCHEIFQKDKSYLKNLCELSYEAYVENPNQHLARIASFIGTEFSPTVNEETDVHNKKYFDRWAQMLQSSPFRPYYRAVAARYEKRFAEHGYSLVPVEIEATLSVGEDVPFTSALCLADDFYSSLWRVTMWLRRWFLKNARSLCPERVRAILRNRKANLAATADRTLSR
jgi:Sulfotransferase family